MFLVSFENVDSPDFIKTAMVIKGFGQVPTTFSSKLIPPQPVGTIDVKQIAHSVGVSRELLRRT